MGMHYIFVIISWVCKLLTYEKSLHRKSNMLIKRQRLLLKCLIYIIHVRFLTLVMSYFTFKLPKIITVTLILKVG